MANDRDVWFHRLIEVDEEENVTRWILYNNVNEGFHWLSLEREWEWDKKYGDPVSKTLETYPYADFFSLVKDYPIDEEKGGIYEITKHNFEEEWEKRPDHSE